MKCSAISLHHQEDYETRDCESKFKMYIRVNCKYGKKRYDMLLYLIRTSMGNSSTCCLLKRIKANAEIYCKFNLGYLFNNCEKEELNIFYSIIYDFICYFLESRRHGAKLKYSSTNCNPLYQMFPPSILLKK